MKSVFSFSYAFLKEHAVLLSLLIAVFYAWIGFQFGQGNNVEEVPIIYYKAFGGYLNDPFIAISANQFNAGTLYTSFFAYMVKLFGLQSLKYTFFLFHFMYVTALFSALILLIKAVSKDGVSSFLIATSIIALMFGEKVLNWMPNQRALFASFVDPMSLVVPFMLGAVYLFVIKRHFGAALLLAIGSLIHPLYTLPLAGIFIAVFLLSKIKGWKEVNSYTPILLYFLSVIPYSAIVWYGSQQTMISDHNPTLMHEIVRAPHHLVIPTLHSSERMSYVRFFELTFLFSILAILIFHFKKVWTPSFLVKSITSKTDQSENIQRLFLILIGLIAYLLGASIVSSFLRVDLIVALTPYRMGTYTLALAFIALVGAVSYLIKGNSFYQKAKKVALPLLIVLIGYNFYKIFKSEKVNPKLEAIEWVKKNTADSSLWLNYSDLDVRTNCLRSDYFQFKTIPLTADGQIDWYKRLCAYYAVPVEQEYDYKVVRERVKSDWIKIPFPDVLSKIENKKPDYLLVDKKQKERLNSLPDQPVFQNKKYEVFDLRHN